MDTDTLFDIEPYTVDPPEPGAVVKLSVDRRRTIRQIEAIRRGAHPLALLFPNMARLIRLHPDADRSAASTDPKNLPLRCGSCRFRQQVSGNHKGVFPKCLWRDDNPTDQQPKVDTMPRVTQSAASDCRAWWPACREYSPGESGSDDAARWIPELATA
jgi:hypothetical protein